tara:strand:- start:1258 stop:2178 length:921 start_codon:yes stop_codon:yes gene_type:complete
MADAYMSSADIVNFNESDISINISDVLQDAPMLAALSAFSVDGTVLKYMKKTASAATGFRAANDGRENTTGTYSQVTVNLSIADASFTVDQAIADGYKGGRSALLGLQAADHMASLMSTIEKEIIIGGGGSDGFASLQDEHNALSEEMVIGAGGTTADTGSSVYAIRTGISDLQVCWGMDGVISMGETSVVPTAGSSTGDFPGYYTPVSGWVGLKYGGAYSSGRLANLTEDSGKGLTDDLISQLLSKFPAGRGPNFLAMNRRSLQQLQASRTATSPSGRPADFPGDSFGVPIIVTDSIINTEALVS